MQREQSGMPTFPLRSVTFLMSNLFRLHYRRGKLRKNENKFKRFQNLRD
jgi:hypothetical protein